MISQASFTLLSLCLGFYWTTTTLAFVAAPSPAFHRTSSFASLTTELCNASPFAVIVQAEIEPDRMAEFLNMIENNAKETRNEPGCLRFDVLRSQDAPNQFFFYELYKSQDDIEYHKKQPHYNAWTEFKASGGTISSTSFKTDAEFLS